MSAPQQPTAKQYATLERAGRLQEMGGLDSVDVERSGATLAFALPRQALSLVVMEW